MKPRKGKAMKVRSLEFLHKVENSHADSKAVRAACGWAANRIERLQEEVAFLEQEKEVRCANSRDYRDAPNGDGPHATAWKDKPHRLLWDVCDDLDRLQSQLTMAEDALGTIGDSI